eukprot:gene9733-9891_t
MELLYLVLFFTFAIPAAVLEFTDNACFGLAEPRSNGSSYRPEYLRFRNNYVVIFSLMMAGDWLQGPYVYHLYEHYGFPVRDIGRLFIMGFGSSAVFGTLAGIMADRRMLGGISTSLLFSAFESWAVAAHAQAGFDSSLLSDLFTKAVFLGNGLMAIAAGLVGNVLVEDLGLGPVAPFDAAIVVLVLGGIAIQLTWEENYGDKGSTRPLAAQFKQALQIIRQDLRVALLGASQALFEASMYTFVFLWTPALSPAGEKLPHGFIFATFMTASMVGTALAGRLMGHTRLEVLMQAVFYCSAVCLFVPVLFHMDSPTPPQISELMLYGNGDEDEGSLVEPLNLTALIAFCLFEVLIGMFWPSMMTLRAKYVPEELRSTIINVFRIPLNVFVCMILWKAGNSCNKLWQCPLYLSRNW